MNRLQKLLILAGVIFLPLPTSRAPKAKPRHVIGIIRNGAVVKEDEKQTSYLDYSYQNVKE